MGWLQERRDPSLNRVFACLLKRVNHRITGAIILICYSSIIYMCECVLFSSVYNCSWRKFAYSFTVVLYCVANRVVFTVLLCSNNTVPVGVMMCPGGGGQ
jgi:hypothetical protein